MAALRSFKRIPGLFQLLLFLLLLPQELAEPIQLVVQSPQGRITAGSWTSFKCFAEGLYTQPEVFMWLKDEEAFWFSPIAIKASTQPFITYRVEIMMEIKLEQGDVKSQLTCHIQETLRTAPLRWSFSLGDVLRVPPQVRLETSPPSPVELNASVTVTCNVDSFYPDDATVELFSVDAPDRKGTVASRTLNPDGTFSLKAYLEVMATEDRNSSMYLCQVQHNSQPLVNETTTLFITRQFKDERSWGADPGYSKQQSLLVLCITLFLSKTAVLLFVSCLFLVKICGHKGTKPHSGTF